MGKKYRAGILDDAGEDSHVTTPGRTPDRWLMVLHGIYGSGRNCGTIVRRLV